MSKTKSLLYIMAVFSIAILLGFLQLPFNKGGVNAGSANNKAQVSQIDISEVSWSEDTSANNKFYNYPLSLERADTLTFKYFNFVQEGAWADNHSYSANVFHYERASKAATPSQGGALGKLTSSPIVLSSNLITAGQNGALKIKPYVEWANMNPTYTQVEVIFSSANAYCSSTTPNSSLTGIFNAIDNSYTLVMSAFATGHRDSEFWDTNNERVKVDFCNPSITLITEDLEAPLLTNTRESASGLDKKVIMNFTDTAGIYQIYIDDELQQTSLTNNTKNAEIEFVAKPGKASYDVRVIDNVGNEKIYTYQNKASSYASIQVQNDLQNETLLGIFEGEGIYGDAVVCPVASSLIINGDNYILYGVKVSYDNGITKTNLVVTDDAVTFNVYFNTKIYIEYRRVLDVTLKNTLNGSVLCETAIDTSYQIKYFDANGTEITDLSEQTLYSANYLVDNEKYYANETFKIVDIVLSANTLPYNDVEGYDFYHYVNIIAPENFKNYELIYKNSSDESFTQSNYLSCLDAGNYSATLTISDEYYLKNRDAEFKTIQLNFAVLQKEISLVLENLSSEYNGNEFVFTQDLGYNYSVKYLQNDTEATPLNAGEYVVQVSIIEKNYTGQASFNLTITPKKASVTAENKSSIYGENLSELTFVKQGFLASEEASLDFVATSLVEANSDVGEYDILVSSASTNDLVILNNYQIDYITGKYTIQKRPLTIKIASGQRKNYGEIDPIFEFKITEGNELVEGEANLSIIRVNSECEDAGLYALVVDEASLNPNYKVEYQEDSFTIVPMDIILKINNASKVYGDAEPTFTSNCQVEDLGLVFSRVAGEQVGRYKISVSDWQNKNYNVIALNGYLTITQKDLLIKIDDLSKVYRDIEPKLTYTCLEPISEDLGITLTREFGEQVGLYTISLKSVANKNYKITATNGVLEITKANIQITAEGGSKVYGEQDKNLKWVANKSVNLADFEGNLARESGEVVGVYAINQGTLASDNYNIEFIGANFEITPKPLVVNIANLTKIYGEDEPEFMYQILGLVGQDEVSITFTREQGEDAGQYAITAQLEDNNYTLYSKSASLTILKADSNIQVANQTFIYDGEAKSLIGELSCEGEVSCKIYRNGEEVEVAQSVGEYVFEFKFAGNQNFNASSATAKLTITKTDAGIVIYRNKFVYNQGSIFPPEVHCDKPYKIRFLDAETAGQVGTHQYVLEIVDSEGNVDNNYNTFTGSVVIVEVPKQEISSGSISFEGGDIDSEEINLSIDEIKDFSGAKDAIGGMDIDKIYEVKYNQSSDAKVKIELDYNTSDYSNVYVYAYNDKNEAKLLSYQIIDGKIVLSVDAENMKFAIVKKTAGISIVTIGLCVIVAGIIALIVVSKMRKKKKKLLLKIS